MPPIPPPGMAGCFGEPVAAASIAQVHRATVNTGEGTKPVAVKVLRAGVERRFARDLADMFFAARLAGLLMAQAYNGQRRRDHLV